MCHCLPCTVCSSGFVIFFFSHRHCLCQITNTVCAQRTWILMKPLESHGNLSTEQSSSWIKSEWVCYQVCPWRVTVLKSPCLFCSLPMGAVQFWCHAPVDFCRDTVPCLQGLMPGSRNPFSSEPFPGIFSHKSGIVLLCNQFRIVAIYSITLQQAFCQHGECELISKPIITPHFVQDAFLQCPLFSPTLPQVLHCGFQLQNAGGAFVHSSFNSLCFMPKSLGESLLMVRTGFRALNKRPLGFPFVFCASYYKIWVRKKTQHRLFQRLIFGRCAGNCVVTAELSG